MTTIIDPSITNVTALQGTDRFYGVRDPNGTPSDINASATTLSAFVSTQIQDDFSNKHFDYFIDLSGVSSNSFVIAGTNEEVATGQSGDYTTDFSAMGHHVCILVNSITTGGDIVITGTSVTETNGVPTTSDTETITVDTTAAQHYQTGKKWLEITNIDVTTGAITGIDYDIRVLGYLDRLNIDFIVVGFRAEFKSSSNAADIRLILEKIQDDGNDKMSIVTMESIGIDSTAGNGQIYDNLRTGGDDRSYTFGVNMLPSGSSFVLKYNDYETYFTSDENVIEASTKNEGIIIRFEGEPSGSISNVDDCTLNVFYKSVVS